MSVLHPECRPVFTLLCLMVFVPFGRVYKFLLSKREVSGSEVESPRDMSFRVRKEEKGKRVRQEVTLP